MGDENFSSNLIPTKLGIFASEVFCVDTEKSKLKIVEFKVF